MKRKRLKAKRRYSVSDKASVSYERGYRDGRDHGFAAGREAGFEQGLKDAREIRQRSQAAEPGQPSETDGNIRDGQAVLNGQEAQDNPFVEHASRASAQPAANQQAHRQAVQRPAERSQHQSAGKKTADPERKTPGNGLHVLIISAEHLTSYQVGIRQPLRLLKHQGYCTFEIKSKYDVTDQHVADADIVIVQRSVEPRVYRYFVLARKLGKRTVYVIDDYYEALPPTDAKGKYFAHPERRDTFRNFLKNADIVKVDSPYFAKLLQEKYGSNVVYFPASVDFAWIEQTRKKPKAAGKIVIGYEGSRKENDFAPVIPALKNILHKYGQIVQLEFYGYVPDALRDHPSVTFHKEKVDYKTFIRKLRQSNWDIGLAPLEDNLFNRCKTNNKFREYAACGIPGIYSDTPAYSDWVIHGETGIVVPHTEEGWYKGIKRLIEDRELREKIKAQAEEAARKHFTVEECAKQWREHILQSSVKEGAAV
jgi:glycosyltransferase involved in cell wall biosynthesis